MKEPLFNPYWASVTFIATKDLVSEKLITFCMILSVAAVLTPIMLLTSVKVGFIDRLRSQFIQDSSFREVRPVNADLRDEPFFVELRKWPDVIYAMPSVMLVPREVDIRYQVNGKVGKSSARLFPSDSSDPLLVHLSGKPPHGDEVVISSDVAKGAGVDIGSPITLTIDRIENDERKRVELPLTVVGIVPDAELPLPSLLADPEIDRAVESYRAGISVAERGWPGVVSTPKQSFEKLIVLTKSNLGETRVSDLRIRLGADKVSDAAPEQYAAEVGLPSGKAKAQPGWVHAYLVEKSGGRFNGDDLLEAAAVLHNDETQVIGINPPLQATLLGRNVSVAGLDQRLFGDLVPTAADWKVKPGASFPFNNGVFLPETLAGAWKGSNGDKAPLLTISLPENWTTKSLAIGVRILGTAPGGDVIVSPSLLAMIYRGTGVPIAFDSIGSNIVEQSAGYRGFRVVASGIDAVPQLVQKFSESGIAVRARSDEILKLQQLDRSLTTLVIVVAAVALAGGFSILSASFFANVQRKRVDFATLRLVGMQKAQVFRIPLVQAVIIACAGFLLSCALYFTVAALLNGVIAAQLGFDGQLSNLYLWHFLAIGVFVILGSCIASLSASREATRIDPAQALRAA
ncbi:FtsX-like permease family protein [Mesorhizobium sp. M1163]|uniref:ABC transporter permease n=1 Tax=Mesorhizobium sp. M1163 TaxID=2957065 RepID=UPI003339590A